MPRMALAIVFATDVRLSGQAPPGVVMGGIFVFGLCAGVFLTLLAASSVPDRDTHEDNRPQDMRKRSQNLLQASVSVAPALLRPDFWIETVSDVPGPRIYVLHNMLSAAECEHLKALGVMAGMEKALIIPYGGKDLVESTTRTNTAAWLDFQQDDVVSRVERILANVTNTEPENGENLQILHYEPTQEFKEHHDYFDPATDPPENFEPGGNRLATAIIYLENSDEGGETDFMKIDTKVKPEAGSAVLFYDLKPSGEVDKLTIHAGTKPLGGEKWVATKWIHERRYQGLEKKIKRAEYSADSDEAAAEVLRSAKIAVETGISPESIADASGDAAGDVARQHAASLGKRHHKTAHADHRRASLHSKRPRRRDVH